MFAKKSNFKIDLKMSKTKTSKKIGKKFAKSKFFCEIEIFFRVFVIPREGRLRVESRKFRQNRMRGSGVMRGDKHRTHRQTFFIIRIWHLKKTKLEKYSYANIWHLQIQSYNLTFHTILKE